MSAKVRITSKAMTAIDQAVIELRNRLLDDSRAIAMQNGNLVDDVIVAQVHASLVTTDPESNNHGERRAA